VSLKFAKNSVPFSTLFKSCTQQHKYVRETRAKQLFAVSKTKHKTCAQYFTEYEKRDNLSQSLVIN
jgi:hypothetical protein